VVPYGPRVGSYGIPGVSIAQGDFLWVVPLNPWAFGAQWPMGPNGPKWPLGAHGPLGLVAIYARKTMVAPETWVVGRYIEPLVYTRSFVHKVIGRRRETEDVIKHVPNTTQGQTFSKFTDSSSTEGQALSARPPCWLHLLASLWLPLIIFHI